MIIGAECVLKEYSGLILLMSLSHEQKKETHLESQDDERVNAIENQAIKWEIATAGGRHMALPFHLIPLILTHSFLSLSLYLLLEIQMIMKHHYGNDVAFGRSCWSPGEWDDSWLLSPTSSRFSTPDYYHHSASMVFFFLGRHLVPNWLG